MIGTGSVLAGRLEAVEASTEHPLGGVMRIRSTAAPHGQPVASVVAIRGAYCEASSLRCEVNYTLLNYIVNVTCLLYLCAARIYKGLLCKAVSLSHPNKRASNKPTTYALYIQ